MNEDESNPSTSEVTVVYDYPTGPCSFNVDCNTPPPYYTPWGVCIGDQPYDPAVHGAQPVPGDFMDYPCYGPCSFQVCDTTAAVGVPPTLPETGYQGQIASTGLLFVVVGLFCGVFSRRLKRNTELRPQQ